MINLALQTLRTNLPIQTQVPVRVIDDESQARLIFDPMRREMLRLLSRKPLTETELSNTICISPPTVHHHLKALMARRPNLDGEKRGRSPWNSTEAVRIERSSLHRRSRQSTRQRPTLLHAMDIERSRGITATVSFLRGTVAPSTKQLETLTKQVCTALSKTAQQYHRGLEDDPEKIIHRLYVEALAHVEI